MQEPNAEEHKDGIQVYPYVNAKAMQHNALHSVVLWTGLKWASLKQ